MTATFEATFDYTGLDASIDAIESLPDSFMGASLQVAIEVEERFKPIVSQEPSNRAKHPFAFKTAKSRRKYFAMIANGEVRTDGYGYVRSGGYSDSWDVDALQDGNEFTVSLFSRWDKAPIVGGNNAVPGHVNTGWLNYNTVFDQVQEYTDRRFFEIVSDKIV